MEAIVWAATTAILGIAALVVVRHLFEQWLKQLPDTRQQELERAQLEVELARLEARRAELEASIDEELRKPTLALRLAVLESKTVEARMVAYATGLLSDEHREAAARLLEARTTAQIALASDWAETQQSETASGRTPAELISAYRSYLAAVEEHYDADPTVMDLNEFVAAVRQPT